MDRLSAARAQLYPADPTGTTRAMLVRFTQTSDWETLATLYQSLQDELELPAPAISVSPKQAYGLWFSLSEAISLKEADAFLEALRRKYLALIPLTRLELLPELSNVTAVPAQDAKTGKWSAYIDPTLGSMFKEEPWLEMAPNPDKQADLLLGLTNIKPEALQHAIALLQEPLETTPAPSATTPNTSPRGRAKLSVGGHFTDPQSFLLAVMNDETASPRQRIQAAQALLPFFTKE